MAARTPGIRIQALAKELEVESKVILDVLKHNDASDWAKSHQASLNQGQAETVRDWVKEWKLTAPAQEESTVATMEKPKTRKAPARKKKSDTDPDAAPTLEAVTDGETATAEEAHAAKKPARKAPVKKSIPAGETPAVVEAPVIDLPSIAPVTPAAPMVAVAEAPAAAPAAPAPTAPAATPSAKSAPHAPPPTRPTITLANRSGATVERKAVVPAPRLVPAPAQIQGPRLIREEKPDVVAAPRPRRGPSDTQQPVGFSTARPATGRGVRVDEDEDSEKKKGDKKKSGSLSSRRRNMDGRRGEAMEKLKEFTDADLLERQERLQAAASFRSGFDRHITKAEQRGTHAQARTAAEKGGQIELEEPITVKSLSSALGIKSNDIISRLMKQGVFASINQALDKDAAASIALEYGVELALKAQPTLEELLLQEFETAEEQSTHQQPRPPVVTILGHVDHGKTSLLDKIRSANVAAGEAGGITQHTAAWMVTVGEKEKMKRVTFIDTPGHQAFTGMRARGANMTDVVVLVVGAVEGVMPQTIESINHARAAGVPIVVAMNKIDRPDANPDMVLGQLAKEGLNPTDYSGDTEVVRTSATTGKGIPELIEILDYQSQLLDLKADPTLPARGAVIESRVDPGLGVVATVLVQNGTLKVGDVMLAGPGYGRIRQLLDDQGQSVKQAGPSMPVIVSGLNELPAAGDKFFVVSDVDRAKSIAAERALRARQNQLASQNRVTADNLFATMAAGDVQTINLIIKADVQGSVETLVKSVTEQNTAEVKVKVIHSGVGAVSESDVQLAMATKAKPTDNRVAIIGFHVVPEDAARVLAEQNHVDVKSYRVIYEIFDDLKKALSGMLTPEEREKLHGHAEIRQVFKFSKVGSIAGCMVTDGHISRGSKIRLIRDGKIIVEGLSVETLRRVKDDVKEVKQGFECGIKLEGYDDIKSGDRLEAYIKETFERTL